MEANLGTIYKFNVHVDGLPTSMDDIEFSCTFYCSPIKKITIQKKDMIRLDENNYVAIVDSSLIGKGIIHNEIELLINDNDIPSGIRKEIYTEKTDVRVL